MRICSLNAYGNFFNQPHLIEIFVEIGTTRQIFEHLNHPYTQKMSLFYSDKRQEVVEKMSDKTKKNFQQVFEMLNF